MLSLSLVHQYFPLWEILLADLHMFLYHLSEKSFKDVNLFLLWTSWGSMRAPWVRAVLVLPVLFYIPHSVSSIRFGCCPCWLCIINIPLGFLIPCSHLRSNSDWNSLVARLSGAYLVFPGPQVCFIIFSWNYAVTSLAITVTFMMGCFPYYVQPSVRFYLICALFCGISVAFSVRGASSLLCTTPYISR